MAGTAATAGNVVTAAVPAQMGAMAGTPQTEAGMAAAVVVAMAETMMPAIGRMAVMMAVTATAWWQPQQW